jgi:hypothetical protein
MSDTDESTTVVEAIDTSPKSLREKCKNPKIIIVIVVLMIAILYFCKDSEMFKGKKGKKSKKGKKGKKDTENHVTSSKRSDPASDWELESKIEDIHLRQQQNVAALSA